MDVFWAIKGGAKSSSEWDSRTKRLVVEAEAAVGSEVSNYIEDDPRFRKKKRIVTMRPGAGRPNSLNSDKLNELLKLYYTRPYSFRELADIFGVSRMTVWRAVQLVVTR